MTGVILGIVLAGLAFIAKWDRRLPMDGRAWAWTVVCALLEGAALREAAGDKPSALVLAYGPEILPFPYPGQLPPLHRHRMHNSPPCRTFSQTGPANRRVPG